jgi:SAM-dependent methyltransferase
MLSWEQAVVQLRNDPTQMELVRACFYDDPLAAAAKRYVESSEWRALRKLIPPNKGKALDLGAGRGIVAHALSKEGWDVTAVEPDPSNIVGAGAIRLLAASAGLKIHVVEACGEELPYSENTFELVHCRAVLHHALDLTKLCNEVSRVLAPGGVFIATREPVLSQESDLAIFLQEHPLHRLFGGENAYLLPVYVNAIVRAGLRIERTLNPFESDINLFPRTTADIKMGIAKRLGIADCRYIPDWLLSLRGRWSNAPGRLFTFLARKPGRAA